MDVEKGLLSGDGEAIPSREAILVNNLTSNTAQWVAVYTSTRHEKRVAEHCRVRHIETFLPTYHTVHRWKNRCRVELELPLFPNYLFARIPLREQVRILQVPGVLYIVRCGREPAAVPDLLVESLRSALILRRVEPHPYLVVGRRVRIHAGPLAGMEGVLVRKKNSLRVVIALDQIMQSVAVEVNGEEVEPLAPIPFGPPFTSNG